MYYLAIVKNNTFDSLNTYITYDEALAAYKQELAYSEDGRTSIVCAILDPHLHVIKKEERIASNASELVDFCEALKSLREGKIITRDSWHKKGMFLMYVDFSTNPEKTRFLSLNQHRLMPTIYIAVSEHEIYPWNTSQADMLADDWIVIGDKPDSYLYP